MSEWKEYKLGETLVSANTGLDAIKRAPIVSRDTGIKCLRIQDISQSKQYKDWGFTEVLENNFTKFKLLLNDIIVARTGATVGVNMIIQNNLNSVFNNGLIRLRAKNEFNSRYIYYLLRSSDYWNHISSIAFGTTSQPNIQINQLLDFKVKVPTEKHLQATIAEILSSLDDKIELNNKINKELESLAQTLFKRWFVDFDFPNENGEPYKLSGGEMVDSELGEIPKGWKVDILDSILTVSGGTTPSTKESSYWDGDIHWTSPRDLSNLKSPILLDTEKKITQLGLKKIGSGLLPKGTLLLSSRAPIGYLAITEIETAINQGYIGINGKNEFSNLFILCWLKANMNSVIERANGSTFLEISKSNFRQIKIVIPSADSLNNFTNQFELMFEQIRINTIEIKELTNLRDTLLPKLISGELEINEITN